MGEAKEVIDYLENIPLDVLMGIRTIDEAVITEKLITELRVKFCKEE